MPLQDYGFRKSQYERPTQDWICGWASEGWTCQVGPDEKGRCRATFECVPSQKGERWYCSRPETHGGKCEDGPLPDGECSKPIAKCQPVRSLRARRGMVTLWITALTVGVLLLFLPGPQGPAFISPGDLTFAHGTSAQNCAICHTAVHGEQVNWLSAMFASGTGLEESKLCLACHQLGEYALQAHGRSPQELTAVTERVRQIPSLPHTPLSLALSAWVSGAPQTERGQLACATCHHEHRGSDFNLADMGNQQCQTCHTIKFSSLANGHPQFSDYPYERRTRIVFDHSSHIGKHFLGEFKEHAPTTCIACHSPDLAGRNMLAGKFERTCASCHAEQIEGAGRAEAKGIAFLRLPGLDLDILREREVSVGEWPADYNVEEGLTPFMEILLVGEPQLADDLAIVADFDDLTDLSDASDEEIAAVARSIWAVKALFYDLITGGQEALVLRLREAMGPQLKTRDLAELTGHLPVEVVRAAQQEWLPNLMAEVPRHRSGKSMALSKKPTAEGDLDMDQKRERLVLTGGWYRQDSDFTILYRPTGHADSFIRAWLDLSVPERTTNLGSARAIFEELADPKAPGLCMKCHSVDAQADDGLQLNWLTSRPIPNEHKITRFAHTVHFSLLDNKGCLTCHTLDHEAQVMEGFADTDPLTFMSNFKPMTKTVCVTCHTEEAVGDTCSSCHNYHVGYLTPALTSAPVEMPTALP